MENRTRVLIIDDEKDVIKVLQLSLASENFEVIAARTGKEGLAAAKQSFPNLILLDLRLPDMDGFDICGLLRRDALTAGIPIIILSTRSQDMEKIVGLEVGADDYVTKPYNPRELIARVRAVLRRTARKDEGEATGIFRAGTVLVNAHARTVTVGNKKIDLTRKQFDLLVYFMSKPDRALRRSDILAAVWGESLNSLQGTVDTHVKTLRKKLGPEGQRLQTLPAVGYRWTVET